MPPDDGAPTETTDWWVYLLWSDTRNRSYVGTSTDVERRLRQHNGAIRGGARATTAGRPWRIAARHGPYPDQGSAIRAELRLKRKRGVARLDWVDDGG